MSKNLNGCKVVNLETMASIDQGWKFLTRNQLLLDTLQTKSIHQH